MATFSLVFWSRAELKGERKVSGESEKKKKSKPNITTVSVQSKASQSDRDAFGTANRSILNRRILTSDKTAWQFSSLYHCGMLIGLVKSMTGWKHKLDLALQDGMSVNEMRKFFNCMHWSLAHIVASETLIVKRRAPCPILFW